MKKWLAILMAVTLAVLLIGCANAGEVQENTGSASSSSSPSSVEHTETSSHTSMTTDGNAEKPKGSPAQDFVPVRLYSAPRGENVMVYTDRMSLIAYINNHTSKGYLDYGEFVSEVQTVFQTEYLTAGPFDANNRAIVRPFSEGVDLEYDVLIDETGMGVVDDPENVHSLYPAGEHYLGVLYGAEDVNRATLYDKDGRVLAAAEEMRGIPHYVNGRIYTTEGEVYDGESLVRVEPRQMPDLEHFTWTGAVGDGYYAVADFSRYKADVPQTDLTDPDLVEELKHNPESFVKALYKDGEVLTGYDYYSIRPVFPYRPDTFYLVDKHGGKILNVKTGEETREFSLVNQGDVDRCYLYPGLCVSIFGVGAVYETPENELYVGVVHDKERHLFWTHIRYDKTHYIAIPQIILEDAEVRNRINQNITDVFSAVKPPAVEASDVILDRGSVFSYFVTVQDRLILERIRSRSTLYPIDFEEDIFTVFYDLKTGERIFFQDLFENYDVAKEHMLKIVGEAFAAERPDLYAGVSDPEVTYLVERWPSMLRYEFDGFHLYFNPTEMKLEGMWEFVVPLPKEELRKYMKPKYQNFWDVD